MNDCPVDIDPVETRDWIQAIESVIRADGVERSTFLVGRLADRIRLEGGSFSVASHGRDYVNSIPADAEPRYPGDLEIETRICSLVRWNACMMVLRAARKKLDLGGHISSFQSAAVLYEVCFNHFFRARNEHDGGDLVYFQGHASPGIYARAFLEGRITAEQLDNFRQEVGGVGLPSYPHPRLMPDFWQFPTVSMGLGAVSAIYQARFLKYLADRGLKDTSRQTVYAFLGDGEMDEPESRGAIGIAAREKLDNLIFVVNCNLQRLDGPVNGNGRIIDELEQLFEGSGWMAIKVVWGSGWDDLLRRDESGRLLQLVNETVDGDYQTQAARGVSYLRSNFFGRYPETLDLIRGMSDAELTRLERGGHDFRKVYAALELAKRTTGKPVVVLAHTVKGRGMGGAAEGMNIAHQVKNMGVDELLQLHRRLELGRFLGEGDVTSLPYISLEKGSVEYEYLHARRGELCGYVPSRMRDSARLSPPSDDFSSLLGEQSREVSTTLIFVRILRSLLRDENVGGRVVPIVADEARTFGMEGLFRQVGIYNPGGQRYVPQDDSQLMCYREDKTGQILQEGISELGATASWLAAATSYSSNNFPMIPFYIFYSMFGFQRVGDLCWAAGDQRARGFLIGGTAGRTTLNGEGLQHGDGHSHVHASLIPSCVSYDPAYAYELAVIIRNGLLRMWDGQEDVFYYLTVFNESYRMPAMPERSEDGIIRGVYKLEEIEGERGRVQLAGSGAMLPHVRAAARILSERYGVGSAVYSITSFTELMRDGQDCRRWNMFHPEQLPRVPYVATVLGADPLVISTDHVKQLAEQLKNFIPAVDLYVLGTDGYGRSDSRENLRRYFEVDVGCVVVAALGSLVGRGVLSSRLVTQAIEEFEIDVDKINPRVL